MKVKVQHISYNEIRKDNAIKAGLVFFLLFAIPLLIFSFVIYPIKVLSHVIYGLFFSYIILRFIVWIFGIFYKHTQEKYLIRIYFHSIIFSSIYLSFIYFIIIKSFTVIIPIVLYIFFLGVYNKYEKKYKITNIFKKQEALSVEKKKMLQVQNHQNYFRSHKIIKQYKQARNYSQISYAICYFPFLAPLWILVLPVFLMFWLSKCFFRKYKDYNQYVYLNLKPSSYYNEKRTTYFY